MEWQNNFLIFCYIFWLFIFFFVLGPFLVWYTGEDDLDGNSTSAITPIPANSTPSRLDQFKRRRKKDD